MLARSDGPALRSFAASPAPGGDCGARSAPAAPGGTGSATGRDGDAPLRPAGRRMIAIAGIFEKISDS
jgi:hypothetical protein